MKLAILCDSIGDVESLQQQLVAAGYHCDLYFDAQALPEMLQAASDLLLIDDRIGMPNIADCVRAVKGNPGNRLPMLLLADGAGVAGIEVALASGLDDYLIKPVRRSELLVRINVLLQRAWPERVASGQLQFGAYLFDPHAAWVTVNGQVAGLTQKEFALALLFFQHMGQPLSRATILETVWGGDREATFRSIDTHVSRIRGKLGLRPVNGFRLAPVYGYGYLLEQIHG